MKKLKAMNGDDGSSGIMTAGSDGPINGSQSSDDEESSSSSSSSSSSEETKDLDKNNKHKH